MNPLVIIAPTLALAAGIGLGYGIEKSRHRTPASEAARDETEPKRLQLPVVKPDPIPTSTTLPPPVTDPAARVAEIRNWRAGAGATASHEERAAKLHELVLMGESAWPEAAAMAAEMFKTDPESGELVLRPDDLRALGILRSSHIPFMLWMLDRGAATPAELRDTMIGWLGQRMTPEIERALIRGLANAGDAEAAREYVAGLRRISSASTGEFLRALERFKGDSATIVSALWMLPFTRSKEAAAFAEQQCQSEDYDVARQARYALACLRPPAAGVVIYIDPDVLTMPEELQHGDVLVSWNGLPVRSRYELADSRSKEAPGEEATVVVYRGTEVLTLKVDPRFGSIGTAVSPETGSGR